MNNASRGSQPQPQGCQCIACSLHAKLHTSLMRARMHMSMCKGAALLPFHMWSTWFHQLMSHCTAALDTLDRAQLRGPQAPLHTLTALKQPTTPSCRPACRMTVQLTTMFVCNPTMHAVRTTARSGSGTRAGTVSPPSQTPTAHLATCPATTPLTARRDTARRASELVVSLSAAKRQMVGCYLCSQRTAEVADGLGGSQARQPTAGQEETLLVCDVQLGTVQLERH